MRQSQLLSKTQKTAPKDEESKNAKLLIQAGFISKEMAGVYSFLPLGQRVMENIMQIIREEMNAIGGQEVFLTALQNPEVWHKSGRWQDDVIDVWFKTKLKNETEIGLGNTHEEPLTALMANHISSYRDLPVYPYQIQTKFRNELRAKSGIMRTREFIMKDLYSFCRDEQEHQEFYEKCAEAYMRIFERVGLGDRTFRTFASGGAFSKFSDEFQTLSEAGEDTIYINRKKNIAVNKEVYIDEVLNDLGLKKDELEEAKAIEVGNIFTLGTRFSEALDLMYQDEQGNKQPVFMGSYGIGPARTMGTIAEVYADDKGLVWPESVAPFQVYLISLPGGEAQADKLYEELQNKQIEVLYDDRTEAAAGEKFGDADLLGIPWRLVVSQKTVDQGAVEVKQRQQEKETLVKDKELHEFLTTNIIETRARHSN